MRIVRLGDHEGPRLKAIRLRALAEAPYAFGSTLAETAARPDASWDQQVRDLATFVAVRDGVDVGMVRGIASTEEPGTALLLSMWVDPVARGTGVGVTLVEALVDWARADGHQRVELEVKDANTAAVALYARLGFDHVGPIPGTDEHRRVRPIG